ncbi:MAG: hypothetical protein M3M95_04260 [Pseudomonadota bacterium]|nr:hypothetical protein [Pseudomonadota bacterium]
MSDVVSRNRTPPARTPPNRGRRGPVLKFLGSLRGDGLLLSAAGQAAVAYQLDVFEGPAERTASGTLDGVVPSALWEEEAPAARLRLDDGRELTVALQAIDEQGAMFDARGDLPDPS